MAAIPATLGAIAATVPALLGLVAFAVEAGVGAVAGMGQTVGTLVVAVGLGVRGALVEAVFQTVAPAVEAGFGMVAAAVETMVDAVAAVVGEGLAGGQQRTQGEGKGEDGFHGRVLSKRVGGLPAGGTGNAPSPRRLTAPAAFIPRL